MATIDFTVAEFLAWARTKPADERYDVTAAKACALGQFATATGRTYLHTCWDPEKELGLAGINDALGFDYEERDRLTFGRLVERLEALCPADPVPASEWLSIDAYLTDIEQVSA